MDFDMKYLISVLLILADVFLFYDGKIDQTAFLSIIATALAILGYVMKSAEVTKLKKHIS
jgi:hypothetical protein